MVTNPALTLAEEMPRESLRLELAGFEVHVERWAGGDRAHVLLVHGLGGNSITWHGVAPRLARALSAQVRALDLPGFGRSRTGGHSVALRQLSAVLECLLDAEAPAGTRWIVAGNSLGAVLALELAYRLPHRVAAVSAAAPALPLSWGRGLGEVAALASWIPAALPWLGRGLFSRYVRRTGLPGVVDEPVRALFGDPTRLDAELRQRLLDVSEYRFGWVPEAARAYEEVTRSLGVALLRPTMVERWIRQTTCPVQAIRGERDSIFPAAAWDVLQRARPDWSYVTLPGVGHVPQLEAPCTATEHLVNWLEPTLSLAPSRESHPEDVSRA